MNKILRVLVVEDSEDDAFLTVRELRRAGYEVTFERVYTEEAMRAALAKQTWDLVLADYTMPNFSGLAALELLKTSEIDIPFVIISGSIGEDLAVAAMKAGAHDYMMKGNIQRLIPSVQRELREAEVRRQRRRAEEAVQRNLQRIKALHEIDKAITSSLKLQTVLDVLLEKIDLFFPCPSATTIRLVNPETGELDSLACRNLDKEAWIAQETKKLSGYAKAVVETRNPQIVRDIRKDPRTRDPAFYLKHGLVAAARFPLIAKDKVLGVLGLFTKEEHDFTAEETGFITALAGQAAIAIHNSQLYEETKRQMVELEKSNKFKDEFLSIMSHELRTPLNIVTGYTSMVKDGLLGEVNPKQQGALDKVTRRANDLLAMINSILYATSLAAETVVVAPSEINVGTLLRELKTDYEVLLDKELKLFWDCPDHLPVIKTDPAKLKQILQNIVNNAIKFTEKGHVKISARHVPEKNAVEIKVADTGIGIPSEQLPIIFEMFRQVDSSSTRPYGGVGMGLYIAKKFTELLGGTIEVEAEPARGSTFTVTIPSVMEARKAAASKEALYPIADPNATRPPRKESSKADSTKTGQTD